MSDSEIALRVAVTEILNLASTMENGMQQKLSKSKKLRIRKESQILFRFQLFRRLVGENFHRKTFQRYWTTVDTVSAPFILTMAGFFMMALGNIHKKAVELSFLQDPLQNRQDIH